MKESQTERILGRRNMESHRVDSQMPRMQKMNMPCGKKVPSWSRA